MRLYGNPGWMSRTLERGRKGSSPWREGQETLGWNGRLVQVISQGLWYGWTISSKFMCWSQNPQYPECDSIWRESFFLFFFNFTILFCHISTWIRHRCTRVPHPEPSSLFPPRTILLGHPSAPAPSIQYCASNLDWWLVSYMILYIFQCHFSKSSHPLPLPQSPKDCSIHQCLFYCLVYRVIVTIFLNSIYMR